MRCHPRRSVRVDVDGRVGVVGDGVKQAARLKSDRKSVVEVQCPRCLHARSWKFLVSDSLKCCKCGFRFKASKVKA